jgi:alpha-2-macroglobulin
MNRRALLLIVAIVALAGVIAGGIWGYRYWFGGGGEGNHPVVVGGGSGSRVTDGVVASGGAAARAEQLISRLSLRLSEGEAQPDVVEPLPLAAGTPLSPEEVDPIVARLPALTPEPGDVQEFNLPPTSLPAPRPGETIEEPFPPPVTVAPPPADVDPNAGSPLEVLRFAPEGPVELAPFVSVTFNQAMVPLDTVDAVAQQVPVTITPALPGVWKWLGPKTLVFEYDPEAMDRLPQSTEYVVEVPAGTESATGGVLAEAVTWTFSTPPLQLVRSYPEENNPQPRDPLFFMAFNQQIDRASVLEHISVTAGGRPVAVRLATDEEIAADERVSALVENSLDARWLAFRSDELLPADSEIVVTAGAGTPSAEGPLTTTEEQSFRFRTYAALAIVTSRCGWGDCYPLSPFTVEFNNPLNETTFDPEMVEIVPALEGAVVEVIRNSMVIRGSSRGSTTYQVTIDGTIQDIFGQTLGDAETVRFRVGRAPATLIGPRRELVTVDPALEEPQLTLYSINYAEFDLRVYAVTPADWRAYEDYRNYWGEERTRPQPPGELVLERTIRVESAEDTLTETNVDLGDALAGEYGHLVVVIEPPRQRGQDEWAWRQQHVRAWVQVTDIGLDAFVDNGNGVILAWATDLLQGTPLDGVQVTYEGEEAVTGSSGLARLAAGGKSEGLLVARRGEDVAILTYLPTYHSDRGPALLWYTFDDRAMYRPEEEVQVKGWLREIDWSETGDVDLVRGSVERVGYQVIDPRGNELSSGTADVSSLGGFDLTFTLPEEVNLGYASVQLTAEGAVPSDGRDYYHQFQIQEFRRPEFEVSAFQETAGPYVAGEHAIVGVEATYYAGGPLPNADVTWNVTWTPGSYSPPGWPGFTFGVWEPWWFFEGPAYAEEMYYPGEIWPGGESQVETFTGVTGADGKHFLQVDFDELEGTKPFSVRAEAVVMDVNRQAWAGNTSLLVHPSTLYVGMRSERTFVRQSEPLTIELVVADIDGNAIAGRTINVEAARLDWRYRSGSWNEEVVDAETCTVTSAAEPVTCTFTPQQGGTYRITASVEDDAGRLHQSQMTRWVSGGRRPPARNVEEEQITLIPDREEYAPGDTAEILVQAPFSLAEGLMVVSRGGVLYSETFAVSDGTATLRVPIDEAHIPNLNVHVELVGAVARTDVAGQEIEGAPPRPAYGTGQIQLNIPPLSRELDVAVAPRDEALAPGGETVIDVTVRDARGEPVAGAEVAVVVVDEAILALTGYQVADPLGVFYPQRWPELNTRYGRETVVLANPDELSQQVGEQVVERVVTETVEEEGAVAMEEPAMEMDMAAAPAPMATATASLAGQDEAAPPIEIRTDFNPLAVFAPEVITGATGQATVEVELPDNLTRYRIIAVAVAGGKQYGTGEANLTARLPLMVRPSAPRFLNFGDEFGLPVVVQNGTNEPLTVDVVVQATNLSLPEGNGRRVTVPANDRVEVRFPAAAESAGTVRLQIAAVSGPYADAATLSLPVYTPATSEAFAVYGVLDEGAVAQPIAAPEAVFPQYGGLQISTSSTALQALTDAVLYLVTYPYECTEQLASRILGIAALRDVLSAFSAEGLPAPEELEAAVDRDVTRLSQMQNDDGGWPVWQRGKPSVPFYSIHVTHALLRAQEKGFAVPQEMVVRAVDNLERIEQYYPDYYSEQVRRTLSAYALYVRALADDADPGKAAALLAEVPLEEQSLEAIAWLWMVLDDVAGYEAQNEAIARHLNNRAVETASSATFTTSYGEQDYLLLHSNRRTDALILDALIDAEPESDLIPKVVEALLGHRTRGRWNNTQENVFVLLALDHYFSAFEAETPEFVARIWLGDTYVGEHTFVGRTTERRLTDVPMSYVLEGDALSDLILSKEGPGRLYYRVGLTYAPADLTLEPMDMGFLVKRTYEAVDDPDDVRQDEDGRWHIRAGARVRVQLTMVAQSRRTHVALVDPLPAGLEAINPSLAVAEDIPQDPQDSGGPWWWWWWRWYEHQNLRDERVEAFTTLLYEGAYEYSYVARATTPGTFVAPPAKAEEMYHPEVFGRSASDWVIVE